MLLDNKYAYNAESNIWYILLIKGIHFEENSEYKIENNNLKIILHLSSNYEDEQFFQYIYESVYNVQDCYKYKFLNCYNLNKRNGITTKYIYDIEINFQI